MSTTGEYPEQHPRHRGESVLPVAQVPITHRHQRVSGGGVVGEGTHQPTTPAGRTCAHVEDDQRCTTILSVYNPADRCALHSGFPLREPRPRTRRNGRRIF